MIGHMVGDVLAETGHRVREAGVKTIDGVRSAGRSLVGFSDATAAEERGLKHFLYERLYGAPQLAAIREQAQSVVANLAAAYRADPALLPAAWQRGADQVERSAPSAISLPA